MTILLTTILVLSWIIFIWSVLLMSPKWWLGMWIAWFSWSNEYWSKKSVESTLKKTAIISVSIFIVTVILLPYIK